MSQVQKLGSLKKRMRGLGIERGVAGQLKHGEAGSRNN